MKNLIHKTATSLLLLSTCIAGASLSAQTYFSDDFNSYTTGEDLPALSSPNSSFNWFGRNKSSGRSTTVELDANNYFDQGIENKYLHMVRDYTATSNFDLTSQQFAAQQTGVVSFDYYTATPADISGDRGLRVTLMNGLGGNPFTYGTQHAVGGFFITGESIVNKASNYRHLDNSGRINYIAGQKNKITIIFNNSSSIFSYGDATVASGKFDIFLNDKKVGTWDLNQGADVPAGTGVTGLWFHIPSSTEGEVLLDNIKFAAMPESSI